MEVMKDFENADTISIDTLALEEMLQEERAKEISKLNTLGKKVCFLHTSLLYYRNPKSKMGLACYETWRTILKWVGGSPNTWRELGHSLGIMQADLDYIQNTIKEDPSDIVLKLFMQNERATLDKILDAFVKMKRYDILKAIEDPLNELANLFNKNDDSGYHSNNTREIISYTKDLPNDLPPVLSKRYILSCKNKDPDPPKQPQLEPLIKKEQKGNKDGPMIFLSYADDGIETAFNIKYYIDNWIDMPDVKVITLNDNRDEVFQNPEKFIREFFEKADFIVPIVTSGYLQEIKSNNPTILSTSDNLDCKYVNFVYNLIINHYIHASGCMNMKVRSVLPRNSIHVIRDIAMYPDLMPWTYENDFDEQFKAFFNKES